MPIRVYGEQNEFGEQLYIYAHLLSMGHIRNVYIYSKDVNSKWIVFKIGMADRDSIVLTLGIEQ